MRHDVADRDPVFAVAGEGGDVFADPVVRLKRAFVPSAVVKLG